MKSLFLSTLTAACLFFAPSPASATNYEYTTFSALESVYNDGSSAYGGNGSISLVGAVINNPLDMLSGATEWQTYIQALPAGTYGGYTVASGDYGGAALYKAKTVPWDGTVLYSDAAWTTELNMLSSNGALKYGDVVLVQANLPGTFYNGKFNINDNHTGLAANDFSITILGNTTPAASNITLANLETSSGNFIFDDARATGCEHYQGSLVHLDGLTLTNASQWSAALTSNDNSVTVQQTVNGKTLTFDMILGLDPALSSINAAALATTPFSVTAILDQEDSSAPYTGGYRLWLTNAGMLTVPEPGTLILLVAGLFGLLAYAWRKRR